MAEGRSGHHRPFGGTAHPWLDASRAPLYLVTYPRNREFEDVLAAHVAIAAVYERTTQRIGWIVDARAVEGASARERQAVAMHERKVASAAAERCAGLALVIPNSIVRGLFTAITWVAPLQYPFEVVATMGEAEAWIQARLAARK